jgi:predicted unusual protein kinase regulating ubiquinone biosynthesis (AarF/ABC1/UbiB family)
VTVQRRLLREAVALAVAGAATAAIVGIGVRFRRRGAVLRRDAGAVSGLLGTRRHLRSAQMVRMGARSGRHYLSMKARSTLASEQRREELRSEFELRTAEEVAETLGHMKGALMKLGQMASYLDQGLPEPVREALAQLQSDAPPMAPELVASVIAEELGLPPQQCFARWDDSPLAAASIGQVHRAVTRDGREVAVKVQYPGVDRAIAADLENTELLFSVLGMLFPGMDPEPIVSELRERLAEELDYRIEADHQRLFVEAYRDHPFIHVPEVIGELSTARVLTTELAEGARFAEVVDWPDEERQLAAETLYRFAFGSIYRLRAFNGDPHPGNYLFRPGGQVTFMDFGLCKHFTDDEVRVFAEMIQAMVLEGDVERFTALMTSAGVLPEGLDADPGEVGEYFGHFYEFVLRDEEMEITPEFSSECLRRFFDLSSPHAELMKQANLPASMVIVQRINLGLYAIFGDLRARNNWRRLAEELWPFVGAPPASPMGERIAEWEATRSLARPVASR